MKKEEQHQTPFTTPEGYFESFPERMKDLIREDRPVKVRTLNRAPVRWAMAAAVAGLILLSIPLARLFTPAPAADSYPDMAFMEESGIFHNEYELAPYLDESDADEEEAYVSQTIDYLAMSDIEMDLIFE